MEADYDMHICEWDNLKETDYLEKPITVYGKKIFKLFLKI
jgi:hypothetical protein